ncbi:MAG: hypothetical protein K8R59_15000 [Thermoanaerobaculales bacterium]|nr:hypothetical protein [Thermoanaerobaculales bacterium]
MFGNGLKCTVMVMAVLGFGMPLFAGPQNMIHGQPAFDSGWRSIPGYMLQIPHGLSGPVEDLVVDLQLREPPSGEGSSGVNIYAIGGDKYGEAPTEDRGSHVHLIDDTDVWIATGASDNNTQARVRVWQVSNPEYDSGFVAVDPGYLQYFTHGLGGDVDDYVVDLTMRDGSSIHMRGIGGDHYPSASDIIKRGASWSVLNTSTIAVGRLEDDTHCPEVRVRIFVRPNPDYDSGWQSLAAGTGLEFEHRLGGPWNDLYVDMQFKHSAASYFGIHNMYIGGDQSGVSSPIRFGAEWWGLTGSRIHVNRFSDDTYCEQIRVRVWASRAPSYDSGWTPVATSHTVQFDHEVGGDPDAYVVDLQFNDADGSIGAGVNAYKYGGDNVYEPATESYDSRGAAWSHLDEASIGVWRLGDDLSADEVRVRLWQAAPPDWDSGWTSINQGETKTLIHGLGVSAVGQVVELQFRSAYSGVNQTAYGRDQSFVGSSYVYYGADWRALTHSTVDVRRYADDFYAEEVRVRIWKTTGMAWDAVYTDLDANTGATSWAHGLGVPADDIVVYQFSNGVSSTYGYHQYQFGGDRINYGGLLRYGAWWENLTADAITLWRALDDSQSNDHHLRLWWTGRSDLIFSDGFESGGLTAWQVGP